MYANEVGKIIRQAFGKWPRHNGFRLTRAGLGWLRPVEDHFFVVTFRTPHVWSPHWGGFLRCRLCIQDAPDRHDVRSTFERPLASLASDLDREIIRQWYNEAAQKSTLPGGEDLPTPKEMDLAKLMRTSLPAAPRQDVDNEFLLRFHTEEDVRRWAVFIRDRLLEWMENLVDQWLPHHQRMVRSRQSLQPFLDAIYADPDSDEPRLVFADWLEERGDPWAEVIRIQCRYPDNWMPSDTVSRLAALVNENARNWEIGANALNVLVGFRRGLPGLIHCDAKTFAKSGGQIMRTFPLVNSFCFSNVPGNGAILAGTPELSAARSVSLDRLGEDDWQAVAQGAYWNRLEDLKVAFTQRIDMARLLDMPRSSQLRSLDLGRSQLDVDMLSMFDEVGHLQLETLSLDNVAMNDEMARRLSEVKTLVNLKRLSVAMNRELTVEGLASLLNANFAGRLEALIIDFPYDFYRQLPERLVHSSLRSPVRLWFRSSFAKSNRKALQSRFPNCSFQEDWSYAGV